MAIDYAGLIALVGQYLNRSDLDTTIPSFIELATAKFNRTLWVPDRQYTAPLAITGEYALPSDFYQMRAIWLDDDYDTPLEQVSVDALKRVTISSGTPERYAILGGTLLFDPVISGSVLMTLSYYKCIPALSVSATTNWLLTRHPDAYLYGALIQAEARIGNDERIPLWNAALEQTIAEINQVGNRQRHSGGPLIMRAGTVV